MGSIISSYIFPHPPIIVPEVGKGEEKGAQKTIDACIKAAENIKAEKPTTIILTSPHGPVFQDFIYVSANEVLEGDLGRFGAENVKLSFENNTELASKIIEHSNNEGIFCGGLEEDIIKEYKVSTKLDHGALIPLYFVQKEYKGFKLVHISIAGLPFNELYRFGTCISSAVEEMDERVVFLASGDLSHRLSDDGPYGYTKEGEEFDRLLVDSLREFKVEKLLELDEGFCESAGECGLRSFIMMFGALDGARVEPEVYSYEGPFGVGYSVARFNVAGKQPDRDVLGLVEARNTQKLREIRSSEDPYVALARMSLETYVAKDQIIKPPDNLPEEMVNNKAGTFVSIKMNGQLRGCIGTTGPTRKSIAEEIIHNAISSGTQDPRFYPVDEDELGKLVYSVDVLMKPEPVNSINELDVIKYGVIVRAGRRSGLLLPNLEGVNSPEEQVSIALQKAGIRPDEKYTMERFEVIRHK